MSNTILVVSAFGLILAISASILFTLKQETLNLQQLSKETSDFFEKFDPNTAKQITLEIETKKIDLSNINRLEEEITAKINNLKLNLQELTHEIYKKSIKSLPLEFTPEVEKFEKERTLKKKKSSYKIITFHPDTLLTPLQENIRAYEKLHENYNTARNMFTKHSLWVDRYLKEDGIEERVKNIQSVNYDKLINEAKSNYEAELKQFKEKYLSSSINNIDFSKFSADLKAVEEKVNTAIESIKFYKEK